MIEVVRMLNTHHGGVYRVYNLCSEKTYNPQRFSKGEVVSFPMDDHEVPSLPMLFDFVRCAPDLPLALFASLRSSARARLRAVRAPSADRLG